MKSTEALGKEAEKIVPKAAQPEASDDQTSVQSQSFDYHPMEQQPLRPEVQEMKTETSSKVPKDGYVKVFKPKTPMVVETVADSQEWSSLHHDGSSGVAQEPEGELKATESDYDSDYRTGD